MRKLLLLLTFSCLLLSQYVVPASFAQGSHHPTMPFSIAEEDGDPTTYPYQAKFPNGSVTDNADGTTSLSLATPGSDGWTDDGTTVRLTTSTDNVSVGADVEPNSEKLQITGSTRTTGEFIEGTGTTTSGVWGLTAVTKTSSFTLDNSNSVFFCDATSGNQAGTLPALSGATNRVYVFKKIDSSSNTCTLDGDGSETIDDGLTAVLTAQYESITVIPNGSQWLIF